MDGGIYDYCSVHREEFRPLQRSRSSWAALRVCLVNKVHEDVQHEGQGAHDLELGHVPGATEAESADTAEAIDTDLDHVTQKHKVIYGATASTTTSMIIKCSALRLLSDRKRRSGLEDVY